MKLPALPPHGEVIASLLVAGAMLALALGVVTWCGCSGSLSERTAQALARATLTGARAAWICPAEADCVRAAEIGRAHV